MNGLGMNVPIPDKEGIGAVLDARTVDCPGGQLQQGGLSGHNTRRVGEMRLRQLFTQQFGEFADPVVAALATGCGQNHHIGGVVAGQILIQGAVHTLLQMILARRAVSPPLLSSSM